MSEIQFYRTLDEYYPFYLSEHTNRACRWLHFAATTIGLALFITALLTQVWWLLAVSIVQTYALAWAGHFFFEHNKPAAFKHPWLSIRSDLRMCWQMLTGKIPF